MNKFRIEVISYLLIAIAAGCVIWFKGDLFWLDTEAKRTLATVALCAFLVTIALYFGFEPRRDETDAARSLAKQLHREDCYAISFDMSMAFDGAIASPGCSWRVTILSLRNFFRNWRSEAGWLQTPPSCYGARQTRTAGPTKHGFSSFAGAAATVRLTL